MEEALAGDRLTSSDKRALILWVVAGIIGALFAYKYFFRAFPEASVNFKVSREEAQSGARNFVTGMGEPLEGYKSSIIFEVDENAKVYLERELGLQQANKLMSSDLNIWYWEARFFKPLQEEEFKVKVNPSGQIVGYEHRIEEARSGASLDRARALAAAQTYLTRRLGLNPSGWDLLPEEANSTKRPNRLDWSFTWEKHGFKAKDAPYRVQVSLLGDRVGDSEEFLKVPEAWERSYEKLRSGNNTLESLFVIPYVLLLAVAVRYAMNLTKTGQTSWRGALILGAVVATLLILQNLNDGPQWSADYKTTDSYSSFLLTRFGLAILLSVLTALTVTLVLPAAEPLYRIAQPDRLQLSQVLSVRGLRSREFFSATVVGVCLAAAHIGFIVAFYIVAGWRGAWAPQELNFDNSVNTAFPWISGAAIGLLASTNEEFTFRLFAIPFFARFTRSKWIAVIVPAFLWGFLHSNYPQEPAYIRGIEIGIIGIVAGLVMLRWGILATLVWHYTVDASLVGLLLVRSNSLYFKVSGVVVGLAALAPLAFAGVSYLVRGRFESDEDLLNRAAPIPEADLASEPLISTQTQSRRYEALAPGLLAFLAVCLLAGGFLAWRLKPQSVGDYLKLSIDARSARSSADQIIRGRGVDPNLYRRASVFVGITNPVTNEFLRERMGIAQLNEMYAAKVPGAVWQVRYFNDGQTEEYSIKLNPDGSPLAIHHKLPEDAHGASLTKEEAIARAEKFLSQAKKVDLSKWSLIEAESDKRRNRIDHELTWQQIAPVDDGSAVSTESMGHAYARMKVAVLGDEVNDYKESYYRKPDSRVELEDKEGGTLWIYIKIPDEWRRKQSEITFVRALSNWVLPILFFGAIGVTALISYLKNLRTEAAHAIPWSRITLWSAWALLGFLVVLAFGDRIAIALSAYDTAIPLKMMFGGLAIGIFLGALLYVGGIALLFGLAWYFGKRAFGEDRLPSWLGMPSAYYRDALWIGLGGSAALLGVQRLIAAASPHWPTAHRALEASFGQDFDATLPAGAIIGGTILRGLFYTGLIFALASFIAAQVRQPGLRALLIILGAVALVGGDWGSSADFWKQFLANSIMLLVVIFGMRNVIRFNLLGCFLILAGTALLRGAAELLAQPEAFYRANGYAVIAALAVLYIWPLSLWRRGELANQL